MKRPAWQSVQLYRAPPKRAGRELGWSRIRENVPGGHSTGVGSGVGSSDGAGDGCKVGTKLGTGVGIPDGFRVETSVASELASTASVVLRLAARIVLNDVLFNPTPRDAANSVPVVVLAMLVTIVKSDIQM